MNRLFNVRKINFLLRVYWLNKGESDKLNMSHSFLNNRLSSLTYKDYIKRLLQGVVTSQENYFDGNDIKLHCACLPLAKLDRLFKRIVLDVLSRDPRLKLNGKLLKKIQAFYCISTFSGYSLEKINQVLEVYSLIESYEVSQIHKYIIWLYFSDSDKRIAESIKQRFKPQNINMDLLLMLQNLNLDLDRLVALALPLELPETTNLIKSFSGA